MNNSETCQQTGQNLFYRVKTARVPRMTFSDTEKTEQQTANQAVFIYRLYRVGRTGWKKAAGRPLQR